MIIMTVALGNSLTLVWSRSQPPPSWSWLQQLSKCPQNSDRLSATSNQVRVNLCYEILVFTSRLQFGAIQCKYLAGFIHSQLDLSSACNSNHVSIGVHPQLEAKNVCRYRIHRADCCSLPLLISTTIMVRLSNQVHLWLQRKVSAEHVLHWSTHILCEICALRVLQWGNATKKIKIKKNYK